MPMLPERISNDLCSLREGQDRPALAVRMTFSADGRKVRHSFHRVLMKSAAKLAYPQAQAAIDGVPDDKTGPILDTVLKPLWDAYAILKRGRDSRQPLELDLPERKILLKEDGTVDRVVVPERLDAHKLIEEFMIQANVAAAETLEAKRQALVYRIPMHLRWPSRNRCANSCRRSACRWRAAPRCARPSSTASSSASAAPTMRGWSTKWCCARRARPNIRRRISAISALT
ncbi:hypothetical protein AJ88_34060 [Mesorhizobium amorphae CCBAU 01583]|nr:hypothetical protein AJ88_34060 [Mesorhizobium amorphae CCBAU 01583]